LQKGGEGAGSATRPSREMGAQRNSTKTRPNSRATRQGLDQRSKAKEAEPKVVRQRGPDPR